MAGALFEVGDFERGFSAGRYWRENSATAEVLREFEGFADMLRRLPRWSWFGLLEGFVAVRSATFIEGNSASYALGFCDGASARKG